VFRQPPDEQAGEGASSGFDGSHEAMRRLRFPFEADPADAAEQGQDMRTAGAASVTTSRGVTFKVCSARLGTWRKRVRLRDGSADSLPIWWAAVVAGDLVAIAARAGARSVASRIEHQRWFGCLAPASGNLVDRKRPPWVERTSDGVPR
jgi:hypothetical protein